MACLLAANPQPTLVTTSTAFPSSSECYPPLDTRCRFKSQPPSDLSYCCFLTFVDSFTEAPLPSRSSAIANHPRSQHQCSDVLPTPNKRMMKQLPNRSVCTPMTNRATFAQHHPPHHSRLVTTGRRDKLRFPETCVVVIVLVISFALKHGCALGTGDYSATEKWGQQLPTRMYILNVHI